MHTQSDRIKGNEKILLTKTAVLQIRPYNEIPGTCKCWGVFQIKPLIGAIT